VFEVHELRIGGCIITTLKETRRRVRDTEEEEKEGGKGNGCLTGVRGWIIAMVDTFTLACTRDLTTTILTSMSALTTSIRECVDGSLQWWIDRSIRYIRIYPGPYVVAQGRVMWRRQGRVMWRRAKFGGFVDFSRKQASTWALLFPCVISQTCTHVLHRQHFHTAVV